MFLFWIGFLLFFWGVEGEGPVLSGEVVWMATDNPTDKPQVYLLPASANETDSPTVLTDFISWNASPRLSRHERQVVFASGVDFGPNEPPPLTELYLVNTSGLIPPVRLTDNDISDITEFSADWSPNDSQLVVEYSLHNTSAGAAEDYTRLAVVDRDGSNWTPLMNDLLRGYNDYCARWNPQIPNYLVFMSDRKAVFETDLFLYDFNTQKANPLPLPPVSAATSNCPTWDSDGKKFYYEANTYDGDIYMVSATLTGEYAKEFEIDLVNTPFVTGVQEYIQCANGPIAGFSNDYFVCLRNTEKGDAISIITTEGTFVKDLTPEGPDDVYREYPDWS